MRKHFLLGLLLLSACFMHAQHTLSIIVNNHEKIPLAGATVQLRAGKQTLVSDSLGKVVFTGLPAGTSHLTISFVGLETKTITITVPVAGDSLEVYLEESEEEEDEVIITATRTSRSIKDIPTRVETISGEELAEKGNMKPGEIRMVLNESTGIQTQQTSATSYSSSIRIQGLDGRYTQLLRDGLPLYSGFSGGLSIMQVTPLDLKQVEIIKGSSSTLYGGGAIAGLVNLVSKTPGDKRELSFIANGTSAMGLDLSGFYSERFKDVGVTVFGSRNSGSPYDPSGIGFTAIPKFERYTINPRVFFYGKRTSANAGISYITEHRTGGNIDYIRHGTTGYFERNQTDRITAQADIQHKLTVTETLHFKSSYSNFARQINIPGYLFKGVQRSSYSEISWSKKRTEHFLIAGLNILTDHFSEDAASATVLRNYQNNTYGIFVQDTWNPATRFTLEAGLRGDYVSDYGFELLPRFSILWKASPAITARVGGGLGYKTPTVFNEESERIQFQQVLPVDQQLVRNERSAGSSIDINYRANIGDLRFTINQLFFYTRLDKPLLLSTMTNGDHAFANANGYIDTKGIETNLRVSYDHFKLFIGYTFADVHSHFNEVKAWLPLTARHRLNNVLMYELEDKIKIGLEAYYFSPQQLSDGATGRSYWLTGLMVEKIWPTFSIFINFENMLDTRQTKFDTIYTGTLDNPVFRDIYAPVDGFIINGGIKLRL